MKNTIASVAVSLVVGAMFSPTTVLAFDTKSFEVYGIKLYDSEAKTIATAKELSGPSSDLDLALVSQLVGGGNRTGAVTFKSGGYFLFIRFAELIPPNKGNVVSSLQVMPTETLSDPERADFWEGTLVKYGPPDQSTDDFHVAWCMDGWKRRQNPSSASTVCNGWPSLEMSRNKSFPSGYLMYSDALLEMAIEGYLRKAH